MTTSVSTEICPISGLKILRKPEWTDMEFDGSHKANISLVGNRIIVSRPSGFITLKGLKQSLAFSERLIFKFWGKNGQYVRIEDFSNLEGTSIDARRFYISYIKKHAPFLGLIFCNASTILKISVKLAKRLNVSPFQVDMVDFYSDAVKCAVENLERRFQQTEVPRVVDHMGSIHVQPPDGETSKKARRGFDEMGYSLDFEMIHGNILHSVSRGFMKEVHISMIEKCMQSVFESIQPAGRIDYVIASVGEFTGVNPRARILYMNFLKQWHKHHPLKMFIFYGSNQFMRTAANLAKPFMPFKIKTVKDLADALEMATLENGGGPTHEIRSKDDAAAFESSEALEIAPYVDEILGYIAQIRWDSEGPEFFSQPIPSHPFSVVFNAILLIKSELDQLFEERDLANEALRTSRDGLEKRVAERTKDLSVLNRKLQKEILKHKNTLKDLKKANLELKETQTQLIQSAKLASIGQLASGVAHELNQPLMVIRATAQITKRRQNKGGLGHDELGKNLVNIEKNTKRMMNIIDHLRLFSRQSARDFERVDINRVIEESLLMIGEQLRVRGIGVKQKLTSDLPMVMGNGNHLEQVMLNLFTNARDAIKKYAEPEENRQRENVIEIQTGLSIAQPGCVEILIRDSGKGISPREGQRIFDPFFTTKEVGMGTGLGLSISYGIIKDHGGEIAVAETGTEGTTFRILLPISESNKDVG